MSDSKKDFQGRKKYAGVFIPAGMFIGMGIGWGTGNFLAPMFIGLGTGFFIFALVMIFVKD